MLLIKKPARLLFVLSSGITKSAIFW